MRQIERSFGQVSMLVAPGAWGSRVTVRGDVSQQQLEPLFTTLVGDLAACPPKVAVCDYSQADMGLGARAILRTHRQTGGGLGWPAALIVPRDQVELWQDYARLQGERGTLRRVFTSLEQGERWAAEMRALIEAQARHLGRGR